MNAKLKKLFEDFEFNEKSDELQEFLIKMDDELAD